MIFPNTRYMVYRASRETYSISALRFASTCFPLKTQLPRREAHRESPKACHIVYEPYKIRLSRLIPLDLVRLAREPIGCRGASQLQ